MTEVGLGIRRKDGESWLDCALRSARPYGLEAEVREWYEGAVASGTPPDRAALEACLEWDVALLALDGVFME